MERDLFSCSDVRAKDNKSLLQHSVEAARVLKQLIAAQRTRLRILASNIGITEEELLARLFVTVFLHDIGKSSKDFQEHLNGQGVGVPHALLSLPFALTVPALKVAGGRPYRPEAIAIMSHHTPFYDKLYNRYTVNQVSERYIQQCANAIFESLPRYYKEFFGEDFPIQLKTPDLHCSSASLVAQIMKETSYYPPRIIREIHSAFEAILHYCDWISSGEEFGFRFSLSDPKEDIRTYLGKKNLKVSELYHFQHKCANVSNNLLLSAPTGKGKTEAALLWAANQRDCRILYLLPTRVSTNAMYERLSEAFPDSVGLSHGTSALVIGDQESWVKEKVSLEILRSSTLMQPVTVATVDQLLFSLFNWRHWEMIVENAKSSSIIFDEIHAYDSFTISLILLIIEEIKAYHPRFAFVSATFPKYLKQLLKKALGELPTSVQDSEFSKQERHKIKFLETDIESIIPEILKQHYAKKSVLVVLNTVTTARRVYRELSKNIRKADLILYHSRFIERDRREKERVIIDGQLKPGFVVVATQVVEVSLDIDYNVLFTQVAPLDDLCQRLGRVNRRGEDKPIEPNVVICNHGDQDHLIYGEENLRVAKQLVKQGLNDKPVTQDLLMQLIEEQYPEKEKIKEIREEFERTKEDISELRNNLWQIQSLRLQERSKDLRRFAKTRNETLPEIEAIPSEFIDEIKSLDNKLKSLAYHVKLPLPSYASSLIEDVSLNGMLFANIEYSPVTGIGPPKSGGVII